MIPRLLITVLAVAAPAAAETAGPSRLQFTAPDKWVRSVDPDTQLVSLAPPGGNAAVTFCESKEFAGTAEQWLNESWLGVLKEMKLTGPSLPPGREGEFLLRTGEFVKPDGAKPWLCLYALVKEGRGESVIYFAANKSQFAAHLPVVIQMIRHITVSPPAADQRRNTSPTAAADTEASIPVLAYNEPVGYYRGAGKSPIEYSSNTVNAGVQIYQFRPYTGDIVTAFQRTLLRDWISPQFRENILAGPPQISLSRVPGATKALSARFHENIVGTLNERMRMLIIAGNQAAIVDVSANSNYSWQKSGPVLMPMLDSIHVEREAPPPPVAAGPGPGGSGVAGLYMGFKSKYMALYGTLQTALHYYVLSADGRVYCCYDFPPGGNDTAWKRFNFNAAQREDPVNTGRYTVSGNQLVIQMSATGSEAITATIRDANNLRIQGVTYERQP